MRTIFLMLLMCTAALGCRADDTIKQGIEGEFCNNRDDDCREGHVCEAGVCRATEGSGAVTCAQMCARLDECQSGEEDCSADCRATIQGTCETLPCPWSTDAIEAFGTCITEDLTCEEIRDVDAPQECYRRIPVSEEREGRCQAFLAAADRCQPGVDVDELRNRCYLLGRTSPDASWARTDACVERVSDGFCAEISDCYNSVFELESRIDLGDGSLNPTEPANGVGGPGFDG